MELVTIYQDDNTQVTMFKKVADYLVYRRNNDYQVSQLEAEEVLAEELDYLTTFTDLKGKKIFTSSRIPYLHRNKVFSLTENYQELEEAVLLLSECFDNTSGGVTEEWKVKVEMMIKLYYYLQKKQDCIVHIFDEKLFGVSGFCSLIKQDKILILPFSLNEDDNYYRLY